MLAGALAAAPAGAATPYIEGVSDQNLGLWSGNYQDASTIFDSPFPDFFGQSWVGDPPSHIQYARFVTAPDAVTQGGACEQNLYNWFTYVTQTLHLVPVIAVWDVAEGGCTNNGAPSTADYTTDIGQLLAYLDALGTPKVQYLEAWNEPNSSSVSAAQAAAYWTAANAVCATDGCAAIAGDLVDNESRSGHPSRFAPRCANGLTYTHMASYETAYVAGARAPRLAGDLGLSPLLRGQLRAVRVGHDLRAEPAEPASGRCGSPRWGPGSACAASRPRAARPGRTWTRPTLSTS